MAVPPILHLLLLLGAIHEPGISGGGRGGAVKMDGVTQLILPFFLSREEVSNLSLGGDLFLRRQTVKKERRTGHTNMHARARTHTHGHGHGGALTATVAHTLSAVFLHHILFKPQVSTVSQIQLQRQGHINTSWLCNKIFKPRPYTQVTV